MAYLIYLRKSRMDMEAEARGEGETLARHRTTLLALARRMGLEIGGIYEEIVSGETIAARPQMQRLLSEVEAGQWEGVLVMEVERLARGDSIDQGIVSQAFKYSGTKIITPAKTYDPANEFDEEYFEFGLFMSRREYKTIKRRMMAGRIASVKEGKYMGKTNPYGYFRVKVPNGKGFTLEPNPPQAAIVREIFDLRLRGVGCYVIARRLNARGERTSAGIAWSTQSVHNVLRNCLYAGYVTWGRKASQPVVRDGVLTKPRRYVAEYTKAKGLHPALVSEDDFNAVQLLLDSTPGLPLKKGHEIKNPFVGLLYCGKCGHVITYGAPAAAPPCTGRLDCRWADCDNVSSSCADVEDAVLHALRLWLAEYEVDTDHQNSIERELDDRAAQAQDEIRSIHAAQRKLRAQLDRAAELVEQEVYTPEYFVSRRNQINAQLTELDRALSKASERALCIDRERRASPAMLPKLQHVIEAYPTAQSAQEKNDLLRTVISRIIYRKKAAERSSGDSTIYIEIARKFE